MNITYLFLSVFFGIIGIGAFVIFIADYLENYHAGLRSNEDRVDLRSNEDRVDLRSIAEQVYPVQAVLYDHNGKPVFVNDLEKVKEGIK